MKRIIEIRAAEGGEDSKLFTKDLAAAYMKHFTRVGWKHRLIDSRDGELSIEVEGNDLSELNAESGGHRIQRVPPTERKGRVHTSTVTVAVIDHKKIDEVKFNEQDFKIEWYSGTGAGGQHRNKHQNSCRITHVPSGIIVTSQCRSRENSLLEAKTTILERLDRTNRHVAAVSAATDRKQQVGSGMRGDKIRTYRFQDNMVKDHQTNRSAPTNVVLAGNFHLLW